MVPFLMITSYHHGCYMNTNERRRQRVLAQNKRFMDDLEQNRWKRDIEAFTRCQKYWQNKNHSPQFLNHIYERMLEIVNRYPQAKLSVPSSHKDDDRSEPSLGEIYHRIVNA